MRLLKILLEFVKSFLLFFARLFYSFMVLTRIDFGKGFRVVFPLDVRGKGTMKTGNNCTFGKDSFIRFDGIVRFDNNIHIHQKSMFLVDKEAKLEVGENFQLEPYCILSVKKNDWHIGNNVSISSNCQLFSREKGVEGKLKIGNNSNISNNTILDISGNVTIGDNVAIANNCFIFSHNHDYRDKDKPTWKGGLHIADVEIGSGSWVGANSKILPGVKIGSQSVIAAGSVVTKDVPSNTIVAGNPAKQIKTI